MKERAIELIQYEIARVKEAIVRQLEANVYRPERIDDEHPKFRQLTRLNFHIKTDEGKEFRRVSGDDLYDELEAVTRFEMEDYDEADEYRRARVIHHRMGRTCDDECPQLNGFTESSHAYRELVAFASIRSNSIDVRTEDFLDQHAGCFQGLRTIIQRLKEIKHCEESLQVLDESINVAQVEGTVNGLKIAQKINDQLWNEFGVGRADSQHTDISTKERYGSFIAAFESQVEKKSNVSTCAEYARTTIVNLRDIGNRPTGMKACAGAMVVVPTSVEGSINLVLKTLPSAAHDSG
ncbi:hypothetical protein GCK72_008160 [Caenorhabditis remanei]|uniref:Uncharacterized protein n=1 Tax=Caenorhabditis remanei TaxID=31234 RepID=A0A6A5GZA2_CAERE|nr:hypothetical protein GCK72_008160 [Caenorhabditis remanei]KAF1759915.1 hypothetical protein GCK72_008160 [Caenorhabditis remanei]